MNENLDEAINLLNSEYNETDGVLWALVECIKDMQQEIDKLKEHIKYLQGE